MNNLASVSSSPHIRGKISTSSIMFAVIIALLPATCFGIYNLGYRASIVVIVCVASAVLAELIYELLNKMPITIGDLSAVVTGLLLALNLPHTIPYWIAALGSVFAIIIVKMLFGGIGQNFMNPALGARCFLLICFTQKMTSFMYDGVTMSTPLNVLKNGGNVNTWKMVTGFIPGTIGETSVIAIVVGAIILILLGVIDLKIPASYLITFVLFLVIFSSNGRDASYIVAELAGGGIMLGAFFMATDYATCPITDTGKIIYGIIIGILTGIFRVYSSSAEGVSYAIIISNLLVPLIEKVTIPKPFGKGGEI